MEELLKGLHAKCANRVHYVQQQMNSLKSECSTTVKRLDHEMSTTNTMVNRLDIELSATNQNVNRIEE